jgi:hypothetical protein
MVAPSHACMQTHAHRLPEVKARPRRPSEGKADEESLRRLNEHRVLSMGEAGLRRRIHKITNISKMESFVKVLRENDLEGLAVEAEEALAALLAR